MIAKKLVQVALAMAMVPALLGHAPAYSMDVYLRVEAFNKTMPDGSTVPMWGYALDPSASEKGANPPTSPGPVLTVPTNDSVLRVFVKNFLDVPTSFVLNGQNTKMDPVYSDGAGAVCTPDAGSYRNCRVRSFTREAPAAAGGQPGMATYEYKDLRPGTYLYQTGTLPQIQVQMGLYGALRHDAPATSAEARNIYQGIPYDSDRVLLFSEVDPAMHQAISAGTFTGSTINYSPKYFLINGEGYNAATAAIAVNNRTVLRILNAGLQSRVPTVNKGQWFAIAEDGNPYPYSREQYSLFLPAAKTSDVWFNAGSLPVGTYLTVFDRRSGLTGGVPGQEAGMMLKLRVALAPTTALKLTSTPGAAATVGSAYAYAPTATGGTPPYKFMLDAAPSNMTMNSSGVINWTPTAAQGVAMPGQAAIVSVRMRVTDAGGAEISQNWNIAVHANLAAVNDAYDVLNNGMLAVSSTNSVLLNDVTPDSTTTSAVLVAAPLQSTGANFRFNADGTFSYTVDSGKLPVSGSMTDSFTYKLVQAGAESAPATVTLTTFANRQPVASNVTVTTAYAGEGSISIMPQVSDADGQATLDCTSLRVVSQPVDVQATAVTSGAGCGTFTYSAVNVQRGTRSFTYDIADKLGARSSTATVTVTIP